MSTVSPSPISLASPDGVSPSLQHPPHFAVISVPLHEPWRPRNAKSPLPGAQIKRVDIRTQAEFVRQHNMSQHAISHHRWAVLSHGGGIYFLPCIATSDRPADPGDFPAGARDGMYRKEAIEAAIQENRQTLLTAFCPRRWAIAIRNPNLELSFRDMDRSEAQAALDSQADAMLAAKPPVQAHRQSRQEGSRISLVHPLFGQVAISEATYNRADVDRILSQAKPAIVASNGARKGAAL